MSDFLLYGCGSSPRFIETHTHPPPGSSTEEYVSTDRNMTCVLRPATETQPRQQQRLCLKVTKETISVRDADTPQKDDSVHGMKLSAVALQLAGYTHGTSIGDFGKRYRSS